MNSLEIRKKFIEFYEKRGHSNIPSVSLIPENDSTLLFVNSGMFPLVPYLLGENHPKGKRLVNFQRSFRTDDIEEVGDNRHTTFFEMLGNWSLGDYFKEEQLNWSYEFLIEGLKLDPNKLFATVYKGNKNIEIEKDLESVKILKKIFNKYGISAKDVDFEKGGKIKDGRIFYFGDKENWWSRSGGPEEMPVGEPGGPDSEIFYDLGKELKIHENSKYKNRECHINCDCGRFIEIGNNVFMEFIKTEKNFSKLSQKNVDFGAGLERLTMICQGKTSVFKTDLFLPIILEIERISGEKYNDNQKIFEIIADHIKAVTFIIGDEKGIGPSNKQQGYFVRRLIRRAIRHSKQIGIDSDDWMKLLSKKVIEIYKDIYPELERNSLFIFKELEKEQKTFQKTLVHGLKEFEKLKNKNTIDGKTAFNLYQTYGFPIEMIEELAEEKGQKVDKEEFLKEVEGHKKMSRTASAGVFKGGLADSGEKTTKLHTATHLLLAALRKVLGEEVFQKGSNITSKRLRFDFSFFRKLTDDEINKVEKIVNEKIKENLPVLKKEISLNEALNIGALASFGEKYPDKVIVYTIGKSEVFSKEICHGPHVQETSEIGKFRIVKEEASGAGVRRIRARVN